MKILMIEHYRDSKIYFAQGETVEAGDNLAKWLIENGKAKAVELPKVEVVEEVVEEPKKVKRGEK